MVSCAVDTIRTGPSRAPSARRCGSSTTARSEPEYDERGGHSRTNCDPWGTPGSNHASGAPHSRTNCAPLRMKYAPWGTLAVGITEGTPWVPRVKSRFRGSSGSTPVPPKRRRSLVTPRRLPGRRPPRRVEVRSPFRLSGVPPPRGERRFVDAVRDDRVVGVGHRHHAPARGIASSSAVRIPVPFPPLVVVETRSSAIWKKRLPPASVSPAVLSRIRTACAVSSPRTLPASTGPASGDPVAHADLPMSWSGRAKEEIHGGVVQPFRNAAFVWRHPARTRM